MKIEQARSLVKKVADDRYQDHYANILQIGRCHTRTEDLYEDENPEDAHGIWIMEDANEYEIYDYREGLEILRELY